MSLWKKCLGILYPQTCCFCGKVSKNNICSKCAKKVTYIQEPICKKCGKPIRYEEEGYCHDCSEHDLAYESGKSVWLHKGPVRWSVYQFKYHNRRIYGEFYAQEMYRLYGETLKLWGVTRIVPVPLHAKRKRKRGYNQAGILAKHLSRMSGIPVDTKGVVRVRDTMPQKRLNQKDRKKNLKEAFAVTRHWKPTKCVLLIDDIYTTGNTIDAVARLLLDKGVEKVCFLTISIGQGF